MDDVKVFSSVDKVVSMVSLDTGFSNTWLAPLLMNIRAQVSELAAVERRGDVENVRKSDRASKGLSSISESDSSTSPTD